MRYIGRLNTQAFVQISIDETTIYGSEKILVETFAPAIIHQEFSTDYIRSIEYTIQVEASEGKFQISKIMCVHDGAEVFFSQYGDLFNDEELATFEVSLDNSVITLEAIPLIEGVNKYSIKFEAIKNSINDN